MTRAALMQCPGDPFVASYWFRNLERVWRDEVDELRVFANGQADGEILRYLKRETERLGGIFTHQPGRLIHGQATRQLVEQCTADTVMLVEDDAFVREPFAVDSAFDSIEEGAADVVSTPRGGMSQDVYDFATAKWGEFDEPGGGTGPGMWPCFFWASWATLMDTSRKFESWSWKAGETIPGLGYVVPAGGAHTDTMTAVAFELRGKGLRVEQCVQHKELIHARLPEHGAPWFHAGGLSTGHFLHAAEADSAQPGIALEDWGHRTWWWRRCVETAPAELYWLRDGYLSRLDQFIDWMGARESLEAWNDDCLEWINWDDTA